MAWYVRIGEFDSIYLRRSTLDSGSSHHQFMPLRRLLVYKIDIRSGSPLWSDFGISISRSDQRDSSQCGILPTASYCGFVITRMPSLDPWRCTPRPIH